MGQTFSSATTTTIATARTAANVVQQRAPIPLCAPPRSPGQASRLNDMLVAIANGDGIVPDLDRLCRHRANLAQAKPLEVQRALRMVVTSEFEGRDRTIVALLGCLSNRDRSACVHLLDGGADRWSASEVASSVGDRKLRREAKRLIGRCRKRTRHDHFVVLSDVDDTVKPWKDRDVTGPVYPGAEALYRVLAPRGDVHFVTARDGIIVGCGDDLAATNIPYGTVAYGTTYSGAWALLGSHGLMIDKKVENLTKLIDRNPRDKIILFGDSGQADPEIFKRVLETHGDRVSAAMIHELRGFPVPQGFADHDQAIVYSDFGDAARALHARGLITEQEREHVLDAS